MTEKKPDCNDPVEFQKAVDEAVKKQKEEEKKLEKFQEYCKQFPKTTQTPRSGTDWSVGDWIVMDQMVYEVVDAVTVTTETAPVLYRQVDLDKPEDWRPGIESKDHWKLKTVPLQGQKTVEGWMVVPGQYVQIYHPNGSSYAGVAFAHGYGQAVPTGGPTYTVLKRSQPHVVELKDDIS